MSIYALSSLTALILNITIGLFVYSRNKQGTNNRYFMYVTLVLSAWILGCFMQSFVETKESALFWDRILYIGVALWPPFYIKFIHNFLNKKATKILNICWLISGIFLIFNFVPPLRHYLLADVVKKYTFRFIGVPGLLWYPITLYIIWSCMVGIILSFLEYKKSAGLERTRMKYFMVGQVIISSGGAMYFLLLLNVVTPPIDNLLVVVYGSIMTYAIVKHQLLEIEVIIRRAVVFAGLFAAVYGVIAFFTFLAQDVFQAITGGNRWFALIPSIFIITLVLRPLQNFLIQATDRFLFQKKYDYRELLRTFADDVLSVMDLKKIFNETINSLINILRVENCGILILNKEKDIYELAASKGIKNRNIVFEKESPLIAFLKRTEIHILNDKNIQQMDDEGTIKEDMKNLKSELILPLVLHDNLIGAITLGAKKSGEPYTQDDLDILIPLSRSETIAISNAQAMVDLARTQAEAAQREKMAVIGTLAAGINHEICNPLGIARGQCEVFLLNARDGLYKGRPKEEQIYEAMKIMEKVIKETDRATAITKKLSSFSKPGTGDINEDVDIAREVDEVMTLVGHELRLEKIDVVKDIQKNLPHIRADRKQVQEIFFNLMRNAGQAIKERGKITIRAKEDNSKVIIEIEDTGHGIPNDKLEQIFNPFYTTKSPGRGTGLGLFIVKQIIQRNRGTISVRSKVGEGTTFKLEFPFSHLVAG